VVQGQRLDQPYLSDMPAPARVLTDIKGKDQEDTVERQMGAFIILIKIIDDLAFGLEHRSGRSLKPDETLLEQVYSQAYSNLYKVIKKDEHKYDHDRDLFVEVLAKLFSPSFRDLYFKADASTAAWAKQNLQKMYSNGNTKSGSSSDDETHRGLGVANNQHYVWNLRFDIKPDQTQFNLIRRMRRWFIEGLGVLPAGPGCDSFLMEEKFNAISENFNPSVSTRDSLS